MNQNGKNNPFTPASRNDLYIKMATIGASGSGKSYTSIGVAHSIAVKLGGRVAVIDSEGKAHLYADKFTFDQMILTEHHPDRFTEAVLAAERAGYLCCVIDSLSHAWMGSGGALYLNRKIANEKYSGNTASAWNDVGQIVDRLIESIVGVNMHVFVTLRGKDKIKIVKGADGKTEIVPQGFQPIFRSEVIYELDIVGQMDFLHCWVPLSAKCPEMSGNEYPKGRGLTDVLLEWAYVKSPPESPVETPETDGQNDEEDAPPNEGDAPFDSARAGWTEYERERARKFDAAGGIVSGTVTKVTVKPGSSSRPLYSLETSEGTMVIFTRAKFKEAGWITDEDWTAMRPYKLNPPIPVEFTLDNSGRLVIATVFPAEREPSS